MPSSPTVLAIDIGTSSCRSALFNDRGERLSGTFFQQSYALQTDRHGAAELDPAVLIDRVQCCMRQTLEEAPGEALPIRAVGTSCFWHSMVGVDGSGHCLTPILTWADARCRQAAADLRKKHDEVEYHAATGCMLRPSFLPARLRWHAQFAPHIHDKVAHWWSPAELLQSIFCGATTISRSMASGTGLLDVDDPAWHEASLEMAGITPDHLSAIGDAPLPLTEAMANEYPALAEAEWYPGIGDGAASNLGSGATRTGVAALNFGTSGALRIVVEEEEPVDVPNGLFHYRIDAKRRLIGGAISNAGSARAWCIDHLALPQDPVTLEQAIAETTPLGHGLTVLPFFTPERSPTWNEQIPGLIFGLHQHTSAIDLYTAICEATYQRLAQVLDLLRPIAGSRVPKIMVGGGVQKSPALLQRLCDALGAAVYPNEEREASLRGAAVFALERVGAKPADTTKGIHPIKPRAKYAKAFARQRVDLTQLETLFSQHPLVSHALPPS